MKDAFVREIEARNWRCRFYDGLNSEQNTVYPANSPVYRHLTEDIGRYSFDGLIIFATNIEEIEPLRRIADLPHVHLATTTSPHDVEMDTTDFVRATATYLAENGFSEITYIFPSGDTAAEIRIGNQIQKIAGKLEIPEPKVEILSASRHGPCQESNWYHSALEVIAGWRESGEFPQAIVVSNDVVMRSVSMALLASGVSVPEELFVMTGASEGINLHYGMPVARYETSPAKIAHTFVDLLAKRLRGEALPPLPVVVRGQIQESKSKISRSVPLRRRQTTADR
jgi:DNA-binding LacI/PurR family transcriptional regulator